MEKIQNTNFFTDFYKKYMDIFDRKLKESSERMGMTLAFPAVRKHIYEELLGISKMVLIFELHCYREGGLLIGDSSEERFESFNEIVGTEEFHQYIEKNYPVAKYINQNGFYIGCHHGLLKEQLNYQIKIISEYLNKF